MAEPEKKPDNTRTYIIFRQEDEGPGGWIEMARVESGATDDAIRALLKGRDDIPPGVYVAVAERQFKPHRVKVEHVTQLKLEEA